MLSEENLIERCIKNDPQAQRELYNRFAPKMWGVCLRFAKDKMNAEDIMQEGFIRVFSKLAQFNFEGSFEGWIRKTFVNTAINYYKKNLNFQHELSYEETFIAEGIDDQSIEKLSAQELMKLVQELPEGYRIVFNLYAVEGYTHKEIGELLQISENTSKSQLSRARGVLQEKVLKRLNARRNEY